MKKLNFKLIGAIVGLIASLILLIFGNKAKVCLSLGLILLGFSVGVFALYRTDKYNEIIKQTIEEMNEEDFDTNSTNDYNKYLKKIRREKRKIEIVFYLGATLLIILGFVALK